MSRIRIPRRAGLAASVVMLSTVVGAGSAAAGIAYLKLGMGNTSNVTTTLNGHRSRQHCFATARRYQ